MAVPVIASNSGFNDTSNNTSRTCPVPSGTVSGDWLLLAVGIDSTATITTPTGWTLAKEKAWTASMGTHYLFKRLADGSEGANITIASTSEYCTGICFRITGADATDCIDVISMGFGEVGDGDVRFGQCWAAYTDNLLIAISNIDTGTSTFSAAPSGFTSVRAQAGGASGNAMASWQKDQTAQGYTGFPYAVTGATTAAHVSFLVVIRSQSGTISYPAQPVIRVLDYARPDATQALTHENPYGTVTGDLLLITNAVDTSVLSPDGDFTSVQSTNNGAVIYHDMLRRVVNGSETPPYTALTATSGAKHSCILRIANADTTSPINVSSVATGTSVSPAGSTITPTVDNCLLISTFAADDDDEQLDTNFPSGYTGLFNLASPVGSDSTLGMAFATQTTKTATGAVTWTNGLAASEEWVSILIAIAPATPTGSVAASAGAATVSGVGKAAFRAVGSSSGSASTSATSKANKRSVGAVSAAATASAVGRAGIRAVAASAGIATVAAVGKAAIRSVGSSAAAATTAATSKANKRSVGASAAAATTNGVGRSNARSVAAAAAAASVAGIGRAGIRAVAASAGIATVAAVSKAAIRSVASAAAAASTSGVGKSNFRGVGAASAAATVSGASKANKRSVASAAAAATTAAVGRAAIRAVAASAGIATVAATSKATKRSVGNAAGTSTAAAITSVGGSYFQAAGAAVVTGVSRALKRSTASSSAGATTNAVGKAVFKGVGNSTGAATVAATGKANARSVASSAGAATTSGVGRSRFRAIASAVAAAVVAAIGKAAARRAGVSTASSTAAAVGKAQSRAVAQSAGFTTTGIIGKAFARAIGQSAGTSTAQAVDGSLGITPSVELAVRTDLDIVKGYNSSPSVAATYLQFSTALGVHTQLSIIED